MSDPLVSVIIASYDRPLFLKKRSIPSVLRQSYEKWEVIVVGDGPADDSLRRATESFSDPRIRYAQIARPDYSGLSEKQFWHVAGAEARNHGLGLAQGEIIAPLDDDDEFLPSHLSDSVDALRDEYDLVYGCVVVRDMGTGEEHLDLFPWEDRQTQALFLQRNIMFHSSVCYSRRFAHLRYPLHVAIPSDYGLFVSMYRAGARFRSLRNPQIIYYGDSLTTSVRVSVPSLPPIEEVNRSIEKIFKSRMLSNHGPYCEALEKAVAEYVGVSHAVAAPSGDVALMLAYRALRESGIGPKRKIIMPSYTHPSTANAAVWNGLEPVFCDIEPSTLCLSVRTVERAVAPDVAAIVAVHAHGNPCEMVTLEQLADDLGLLLISDAAAAFGATLGGRRIGSFGDMEVFSLSGTKVLTAGEGGMICCEDGRIAETLRHIGNYGICREYICETQGLNGKMAELPAALALASLPFLENWLTKRREAAQKYQSALADIPGLRLQRAVSDTAKSCWKDMPLVLSSAEAAGRLAERLRVYRIQSRPYYRPLHRMPAFAKFAQPGLRETERLADCVLCVPLYGDVLGDTVDLVCDVVKEVLT